MISSLYNKSDGDANVSFFDNLSYMETQTPQTFLDHQIIERNESYLLKRSFKKKEDIK